MKTPWAALTVLAFMSTNASPQARCDGDLCGHKLMTTGWQRIAGCAGHTWSYLLAKDDKVLICHGVNARDGPRETPCTEFSGDIDQYRLLAAKPRDARVGTDCWQIGGR
jgi:hypothetical protein